MAEWSIHAVCCDVIVEDGQHRWPFILLLLLLYYYYYYYCYTNSTITHLHFVQWRATVPHMSNIQQVLQRQTCHIVLFVVGSVHAEHTSVIVFKYECKCRDSLCNIQSLGRAVELWNLDYLGGNGVKCFFFLTVLFYFSKSYISWSSALKEWLNILGKLHSSCQELDDTTIVSVRYIQSYSQKTVSLA